MGYFAKKITAGETGGAFFTIGFILLSSELLTLNRLGYLTNKNGWGVFPKEKK